MKVAYLQPGDGSRYMVAIAQVINTDHHHPELWFAFGRADQALAIYPLVATPDAVDDFQYFRRHWASGVEDNLWELWIGLMVLRHLLGRSTHWPALPAQLLQSARSAFEGQGIPFEDLAERPWQADWQQQLLDVRLYFMQLVQRSSR